MTMNNNALQVFNNGDFQIRTINDDDGNIWFVAKDVALALDYSEESMKNIGVMIAHVPDSWKGRKRITTTSDKPTARPYQEVLCLTEQGLYFFLGRSDKKKALPFQMWIAGDVVPSIRKSGMYITPQKAEDLLNDPDVWIKVLQGLKEERAKVQALNEQIEHDRPKVIFAESVETSSNSILIRELAKLLRQNGYIVGQNRLFEELRNRGFLIKYGSDYNMPTQKSMELGLMEIKTTSINRGDGQIKICKTPKITGKGQIYFINLFLGKKNNG